DTPKPLLPIANKPILERTLEALARAGIRQIILVVGFRNEKIRDRLGKGEAIGSEIRYVNQKTPKGTADALGTCSRELRGEDTFLVIYGDDYYDTSVPETSWQKPDGTKASQLERPMFKILPLSASCNPDEAWSQRYERRRPRLNPGR